MQHLALVSVVCLALPMAPEAKQGGKLQEFSRKALLLSSQHAQHTHLNGAQPARPACSPPVQSNSSLLFLNPLFFQPWLQCFKQEHVHSFLCGKPSPCATDPKRWPFLTDAK